MIDSPTMRSSLRLVMADTTVLSRNTKKKDLDLIDSALYNSILKPPKPGYFVWTVYRRDRSSTTYSTLNLALAGLKGLVARGEISLRWIHETGVWIYG